MNAEEIVDYISDTIEENTYEFILLVFDAKKDKRIGYKVPPIEKDEETRQAIAWLCINHPRAKTLIKEGYDLAEDDLTEKIKLN